MDENIYNLIKKRTNQINGVYETPLNGVRVFYLDETTPRKHIPYKACLIFIFQGHKIGYFQGKELTYNADNYLALATPLPFECQAFASKENPLIGMSIEIDSPLLQEIWNNLEAETLSYGIKNASNVKVAEASVLSEEMKETLLRLLTQLEDKQSAKILARNTVKEIFYQILTSKKASSLYALADRNSPFTRIATTLSFIDRNLSKNITISELAQMSNMSVTTFHRVFKKITGDSPLQFIKKARLSQARDFMEYGKMKVNLAAQQVGYESISQFSREFKRLFGVSPKMCLSKKGLAQPSV